MATTANDKVIFTRTFNREGGDKNDSFYIRFEGEENSPLAAVQPIAMSISEAFSFATPIITITFNDGVGAYFNMIKMDVEYTYYLDMGGTKFKSTRIPLKIAKIQLKNLVGGKSTQVSFKVTLVHKGWSELLNVRHNRGFDEMLYSDMVKKLVDESGYKSVKIHPSKGSYNAIQPHWTNLVMLKWIQDRAVPAKFDDHYEFGCNIDGDFFFSSMSDIVTDKKSEIMNKQIPVLNLGGYADNEMMREKDITKNYNIPNHFYDFNATEHYMDTVINGGGGVVGMHYDFKKDEFVTKPHKVSSSSSLQLSDFTSIKQAHEASMMRIYAGNDIASSNICKSFVSSVALSMNQFQIVTEGTINAHIGGVVELIIRNDKQIYKSPYSTLHSGFYVIASVSHVVTMSEGNKFNTVINLARSGINGKDLKGYVKTKSGKFA